MRWEGRTAPAERGVDPFGDASGGGQPVGEILAADNRNARARFLLGQAYEGLGSYDEAIRNYNSAIYLYFAYPEDRATVQLALAKLYLNRGCGDEDTMSCVRLCDLRQITPFYSRWRALLPMRIRWSS